MKRLLLSAPLFLAFACASPEAAPTLADAPPPPQEFLTREGPGLKEGPADLAAWWTKFKDPTLDALIEKSVAGNLELKQALSRAREARSRREGTAAQRFPTIKVNSGGQRSRASGETLQGQFFEPETNTLYSAGFDARWEIDIWGRIARSIDASESDLLASIEDARAVYVTLLSETALNYVELRNLETRLGIAQANVELQSQTLKLAEDRLKAGLVNRLDVSRARSDLEETRSSLPPLRAAQRAVKNRLAAATGQAPGALDALLATAAPVPEPGVAIAVGVPAAVLRRRPDIRAAERRLLAEVARRDVAAKDRYPKLSLVGNIGLQSIELSDLFKSGAGAFSFGPQLDATIFDGGRLEANLAIQTERQRQAFLAYRQAVLTALGEVENALAAFVEQQARGRSLETAAGEARSSVTLARDQYRQGLVGLQAVLDSQRAQFRLDDQLAQNSAAIASETIRIYKALGGGWENEDVAKLEAEAGLKSEDR